MVPVLGYWGIRSLCQPIRLLLKYTNEEFEDKKYIATGPKGSDRSCWTNEKYKLGLDFPNLPYYFDGDIKLTQSSAILRHIARKHNLCGKTEQEKSLVDMLENQVVDFRLAFEALCYGNDTFEANKPGYIENARKPIKAFADYLGDKKYLVGDELTYVDFQLYEVLDQHRVFEASLLEPHKNLKDYCARIEALPAIAAFMKSDGFITRPINDWRAAWN